MNKIKSNILHYPLVSIIVLNYNGLDQLKKSFKSLLRLDYPNYEIILVDNCSSDNSLNYIEKLSNGNVRIEILDQNYGYSKGKNIGASLAKGEFIWLLDNDIIPNKDCLKKLVSFMKKVPEAAVSFPVLIDFFSKKISHYGGESTYYGINQFLEKLPIDKFDGKRPFKTSYPIGAVAFYRKEVWDYLNGYDDLNKFYLDDTDLGPRIWISGYKIYCIPNAKSFHYEISRKKDVEYLSWIFENFVSGIAIGIIKNYSLFNLLLSFII